MEGFYRRKIWLPRFLDYYKSDHSLWDGVIEEPRNIRALLQNFVSNIGFRVSDGRKNAFLDWIGRAHYFQICRDLQFPNAKLTTTRRQDG